jgi:NADH/NAD ratio-sensing transcriptional regulator Rex
MCVKRKKPEVSTVFVRRDITFLMTHLKKKFGYTVHTAPNLVGFLWRGGGACEKAAFN